MQNTLQSRRNPLESKSNQILLLLCNRLFNFFYKVRCKETSRTMSAKSEAILTSLKQTAKLLSSQGVVAPAKLMIMCAASKRMFGVIMTNRSSIVGLTFVMLLKVTQSSRIFCSQRRGKRRGNYTLAM